MVWEEERERTIEFLAFRVLSANAGCPWRLVISVWL